MIFSLERITKFNETCCEIKGVPEECMGKCKEKLQSFRIQMPADRCAEHQEVIESCMYEYGKKYLNTWSIV